MRKSLLAASALVGASLLVGSAAEAKKVTYISVVPPAGATSTAAFGINDDNIIAGQYTDSAGVVHGFFGPLDGKHYTTFDYGGQGTSGTQPRAILNDGTITGIGLGGAFNFGAEFVRLPDGTINTLKKKSLVLDGVVQGGNDHGQFAGDYLNKSGIRTGYLGKNDQYKKDVTLNISGIQSTDPRQINNHGVIGGSYIDSGGIQHGFILDGSQLSTFDYPDAVNVTAPEGINSKGHVVGLWQDSGGSRHGFWYNPKTGDFMEIGPDDGSAHEAWGVNNSDLISGDSTGTSLAWVFCPHRKSQCPKGGSSREVDVRTIHVARGDLMKKGMRLANVPVKKYANHL